jgi:hypothetical protein
LSLYRTCVQQFIDTYESPKDPELWMKLVNEEADEVFEATANLLKEYSDFSYVIQGLDIVNVGNKQFDDFPLYMQTKIKRVVQIMECFLQAFPDEKIDEAFMLVHASNMSKLDDDGKPIRRSDGKILKGPNYKAPDLLDLVY